MEHSKPPEEEVFDTFQNDNQQPIRLYKRPHEERRILSVKKAWTERKKEILAKTHTVESNKKRSESLINKYLKDSEFHEGSVKRIQDARQKSIEIAHTRRTTVFGNDVAAKLYNLHHIQALTVEEIARDSQYSEKTIVALLTENNIPYIPHTPRRSVRLFQQIQTVLWSKPEIFQRLNEEEKSVISNRYLSEGSIPTLVESSERLQIPVPSVRKFENTAIRKLTRK